jgi:hypothetical protein
MASDHSNNYRHPADSNLRSVHKAMEYNLQGQPILRVTNTAAQYSVTGATNVQMDAFGRQRVSNPYTLFDNTFRYSTDTRNWGISTAGSGSSDHLENESSIQMSVSNASGDRVYRETKRCFQYLPGKSLLIMNTFVMAPGKENLRQRVGYFSNENGIFVEQNGTTTYIVKRDSLTSAPTDTQVAQANWNVDKLDGTGTSGVTLDMTKAQIFWTDLEWLGVGSVRTGFVINGQFIVCHIFHHANSITSVYMTTASLPIRYEIENTGATSGSSVMKQICSTVISEGGYTPRSESRAVSTALAGLAMSDSVAKPLVSIRLKADKQDAIVTPTYIDMYGLQNAPYRWAIYQDTTIATGSWVSGGAESNVEYNVTATDTITGARKLLEGTIIGAAKGGGNTIFLDNLNHSLQLKRDIDGTPEVFTLAMTSTTPSDYALGTVAWQEFN